MEKCEPVSTTPKPVTLIAEVAVNKASAKLSPETENAGNVSRIAAGIKMAKKLKMMILGSDHLFL